MRDAFSFFMEGACMLNLENLTRSMKNALSNDGALSDEDIAALDGYGAVECICNYEGYVNGAEVISDWIHRLFGINLKAIAKQEGSISSPVLDELELALENGGYIEMHFSDPGMYVDGCDSSIDYTWYDSNHNEIDGGQYDYCSEKKTYCTIADAINDVLIMVFGDDVILPKYHIL